MADFRAMQAEVFAARAKPSERRAKKATVRAPAKSQTIWLVAAWMGYSVDGPCAEMSRWKIHRDTNLFEFSSEEAAQKFAESLEKTWTNRKIIKVFLTGE